MKWMFISVFIFELSNASVSDLATLAISKNLQKNRTWLNLLHFQRSVFGVLKSQIKDPQFFLSPQGDKNADKNAADELAATLKSFFDEATSGDRHAICRFPARLKWLKEKLGPRDEWSQLPKPKCHYYGIFKENLNARSISFVFSSYYADNPSSSFGHTFFRVNKKNSDVPANELLDFGISYAANVSTENPILYVLYGLFGGFRGTYASVPFYYKVREYNDYESRDLWSYELNLSDSEVEQFISHLWEVGPHYFDYYFFTQNCSYHMLTLLEAASERIDLVNKVPFYVIPSDALKALNENDGLIGSIAFRPSLKRQFQVKWKSLNSAEQKKAKMILGHEGNQNTAQVKFENETQEALAYDALVDYADVKDPKGVFQKQGKWFELKQKLLLHRAALNWLSPENPVTIPVGERPDLAHRSARVNVGLGDRIGYLGFRFAFHDLLDPSTGLPEYSQVEFGHFQWQWQDKRIQWNYFSLFNLLQINPIDNLDQRWSWGVDVGAEQVYSNKDLFSPGIKVFLGGAIKWHQNVVWLLPYSHFRYSEDFDFSSRYLALGFQFGYFYSLSSVFKTLLKYSSEFPIERSRIDFLTISGRYAFHLDKAIELQWDKSMVNDFEASNRMRLNLYYFF